MENFNSLRLPEQILHCLEAMKFTKPTPIQEKTIPLALDGRDVLGSAQTGTGKTAAFGIPLVAHLMENPESNAIILTPTRELAAQVLQSLQGIMGKKLRSRAALLIGGDPMFKQLQKLKSKPRLIVGTPGRVNDHLMRGTLDLSKSDFFVLDETDRMLDMGFTIQIDKIVKHLPEKRQTLLFSATLPANIKKIAAKYMDNPERVAVGDVSTPVAKIKQDIVHTPENDKYSKLLGQLNQREGSIIVFVKTKYSAERMAKRLRQENLEADAIHGDLRHNKRERVIKAFHQRKYRIMVATDIAARGLDIPHIEHVINYDLPQCPEDYIHRIGRTARAGSEGEALSFVSPSDKGKWRAIHALLNPEEAKKMAAMKPQAKKKKKPFRFKKSKKPGFRKAA